MVYQTLKFLAGLGALVEGAKVVFETVNGISPQTLSGLSESTNFNKKLVANLHDVSTIDQRVGYVLKMIKKSVRDPRIRQLAVQTVSKKCGKSWCVREKDYIGEANAIYELSRSKIRYVRDVTDLDTFQAALRTFQFNGGDCDDYVIFAASLLTAIGHKVKLKVIRTRGSPEWNHIYMKVGIPPQKPTRWISFDASVPKQLGWEAPKQWIAEHRYYDVHVQ